MMYRSRAKPSRSGNDCTEEDQRESEHEALMGFDVVDPSDQMYSERSICLVGSRARLGSTRVDWLRASYDTLRLVATGWQKIAPRIASGICVPPPPTPTPQSWVVSPDPTALAAQG
jgi:hypothetical protein